VQTTVLVRVTSRALDIRTGGCRVSFLWRHHEKRSLRSRTSSVIVRQLDCPLSTGDSESGCDWLAVRSSEHQLDQYLPDANSRMRTQLGGVHELLIDDR
jgi:hypothetical protein